MLGWKDKLGYDFEFEAIERLIMENFGRFITYANPRNIYEWLKKKRKGVDIVLHIGKYRIYIECRFQSHFYRIHNSWFQKSTMQRFAPYPHGKYDIHIVLTNKLKAYDTPFIRAMQKSQGVLIYDIHQLVSYINNLLPVTVYTNQQTITMYNKSNNANEGTGYSSPLIAELERRNVEQHNREMVRLRRLYGKG
jgi:hypothetical protein